MDVALAAAESSALQRFLTPFCAIKMPTDIESHAGLTALEFYSGIGGLHYGLLQASPGAKVAAAFDLNDVANETYSHNFGMKPKQANVGKLKPKQLDAFKADVWMLSPPCQPYTRKGLKKDSKDGRAESFLEVLDLIGDLKHPPTYILVENVVGFEASDTRKHLVGNLGAAGYALQEFILSPLQFGIPYSRPRYFALAKRTPLKFASPASLDEPPRSLRPSSLLSAPKGVGSSPQLKREGTATVDEMRIKGLDARPVSEFLVAEPLEELNDSEPQWQHPPDPGDEVEGRPGGRATGGAEEQVANDPWALYGVPLHVIQQNAAVLDVVGPRATRINCFTKTYTRYAKATGSILVTRNEDRLIEYRPLNGGKPVINADEAETAQSSPSAGKKRKPAADEAPDKTDGSGSSLSEAKVIDQDGDAKPGHSADGKAGFPMAELGLRYFTPRELANFHSFPPEFSFPSSVTLRQRYALLGNSLSVAVVADLLKYLLEEPDDASQKP